jgi:hypothetical protein
MPTEIALMELGARALLDPFHITGTPNSERSLY